MPLFHRRYITCTTVSMLEEAPSAMACSTSVTWGPVPGKEGHTTTEMKQEARNDPQKSVALTSAHRCREAHFLEAFSSFQHCPMRCGPLCGMAEKVCFASHIVFYSLLLFALLLHQLLSGVYGAYTLFPHPDHPSTHVTSNCLCPSPCCDCPFW